MGVNDGNYCILEAQFLLGSLLLPFLKVVKVLGSLASATVPIHTWRTGRSVTARQMSCRTSLRFSPSSTALAEVEAAQSQRWPLESEMVFVC